MGAIQACPLPERSLLQRYARVQAYTDCYVTDVAGTVSCERFVEAFYTTRLFKLERLILKLALARPSTDAQAAQLAAGALADFAAWRVEARADDQLLMADVFGNTRSWFMVEPGAARTRLYFGSAVTEQAMRRASFRWLLGFHVAYSKALLHAARRRLERRAAP
jgi:hypothetical protein